MFDLYELIVLEYLNKKIKQQHQTLWEIVRQRYELDSF